MKNTIKRDYERTVLEDGSIDLTFKASRFLDAGTNTIVIGIWGVVVTMLLMAISPKIKSVEGFFFFLAVMAGGSIYTLISIVREMQVIKIHPNKGIEFRGESLPFSDILNIGMTTRTNKSNGPATLYVESNGKQVKVAQCKESLANALKNEIKNSSGIEWN